MSPPPFLAIPLELRTKIYNDLLTRNTYLTLYHDRSGRDRHLNLHPAILRVNHQIYTEAIDILYTQNIFYISLLNTVTIQCKGGYYADRLPSPGPLFRTDLSPAAFAPIPHRGGRDYRYSSDSIGNGTEEETEESKRRNFLNAQGVIYPHCLARMHHIQLWTAGDAIRGSAQRGPYFSHIGRLIIEILGCLVDRDKKNVVVNTEGEESTREERKKKILEMTIVRRDCVQFGRPNDIEKVDELFALLRKLRETRDVLEETADRYYV